MFGDYIHKNIQSTLFNRIDALNRKKVDNPLNSANPNSNQDSFLMGATWAKVTSAVPEVETNDDGDITKIKDDKLFRLSSDYSPTTNNRINEPLSIRSSKNTDRTFRGHNGVTGITVTYLNQTTLSTTITWVLNDIKEFEVYQNAFLTPSRVVLVEFGWSREKPQEIPDIETSEEMFDFFKANQEKITFYGGDYFATCGIVKNFNYNLVEGGRYECTTELVSMGNQLFKSPKGRDPDQITPSLVNDFFNMNTPETQKKFKSIDKTSKMGKKRTQKLKELIINAQKSSFERVMNDLNVYIKQLRNPGRKPLEQAAEKVGYMTSDQTYTYGGKSWCTWGWFEDNILNTYFGLIIKKTPQNNNSDMDDEWIARFNSSWRTVPDDEYKRWGHSIYRQDLDPDNLYELNLCRSEVNLFTRSFDIIFPGKTIEMSKLNKSDKVLKDMSFMDDVEKIYHDMNQTSDNSWGFPAFEPEGLENSRGIIRNIVFSADILIQHFAGTSNVGQAIKSLWAYVTSQYGGFWDFDMLTDTNDTTSVGVYDRNITRVRVKNVLDFPDSRNQSTKKDPFKTFQFKVYSKDSLVKEMTFNTQLSSEMMTQALYSGNSSTTSLNGILAGVPGDKEGRAVKAFSALQNYNYLDKEVANKEIDAQKLQRDKLLDDVTTPYMIGQVAHRDKGKLSTRTPQYIPGDLETTEKAVEAILLDVVEEVDADAYKWFDVQKALNDRGIIYDQTGKMLEAYSKSMLFLINKTDKAQRSVDVPIPFNCSFSIAGIAGIKLYDFFTVDYIPELYREFAVFQVTGITQTLDSSGWTTGIEGLMRVDVDELALKRGKVVPDETMAKIKHLDNLKIIDLINSSELPDKPEAREEIIRKQNKNLKKNVTREATQWAEQRKEEVAEWNEENFIKADVNAIKLYKAMKGGGTNENEIWAVYEHPELKQIKNGYPLVLNAKTRMEIQLRFNRRYAWGIPGITKAQKKPEKHTLEAWFKSDLGGKKRTRALKYLE